MSSTPWYLGEDKVIELTVTDAAGAAVNITGWSLSFMVKRHREDADVDALITKTTDDDIALTDPTHGEAEATVEKAALADVVSGSTYFREWKRTDSGFNAVLVQERFEF